MSKKEPQTLDEKCRHSADILLKEDTSGLKMIDMRRLESMCKSNWDISDEDVEKWIGSQQMQGKLKQQVVGARCFICFTSNK